MFSASVPRTTQFVGNEIIVRKRRKNARLIRGKHWNIGCTMLVNGSGEDAQHEPYAAEGLAGAVEEEGTYLLVYIYIYISSHGPVIETENGSNFNTATPRDEDSGINLFFFFTSLLYLVSVSKKRLWLWALSKTRPSWRAPQVVGCHSSSVITMSGLRRGSALSTT